MLTDLCTNGYSSRDSQTPPPLILTHLNRNWPRAMNRSTSRQQRVVHCIRPGAVHTAHAVPGPAGATASATMAPATAQKSAKRRRAGVVDIVQRLKRCIATHAEALADRICKSLKLRRKLRELYLLNVRARDEVLEVQCTRDRSDFLSVLALDLQSKSIN